jgi:hypothetical protein
MCEGLATANVIVSSNCATWYTTLIGAYSKKTARGALFGSAGGGIIKCSRNLL